ncbi:hypothetical protein J8984_22390 [Klebsiella quasipneumoniae subsp. similipneumoniae]
MTLQEASISTERLKHLIQTIAENYYEMEDGQRYSLLHIACDMSADIDGWMNAEEERRNATTKRN